MSSTAPCLDTIFVGGCPDPASGTALNPTSCPVETLATPVVSIVVTEGAARVASGVTVTVAMLTVVMKAVGVCIFVLVEEEVGVNSRASGVVGDVVTVGVNGTNVTTGVRRGVLGRGRDRSVVVCEGVVEGVNVGVTNCRSSTSLASPFSSGARSSSFGGGALLLPRERPTIVYIENRFNAGARTIQVDGFQAGKGIGHGRTVLEHSLPP